MDAETLKILGEHRKILENHRQCIKDIDTTLTTLIGACSIIARVLIDAEIISGEEFNSRVKEQIGFIRAKDAHSREVKEFLEGKKKD